MNWYKIAQYADEPPEWDFPEAEHDYNPSWDYAQVIPDEKLKAITEEVMNDINNNLMPQIGMGKAKTAYIEDADGALAKYVHGTQPYPVFVIDLESIRRGAEKYGVDIGGQIEATLIHELGHAIQEWMGLEMDEDEAESFAEHYHYYRELKKFWE